MKGETIALWTAQADIVLETIDRDGVYYVKKRYVDQKYQESAWIFQTAYRWFARAASQLHAIPEGAESPIWLYKDPGWTGVQPGNHLLNVCIPADELIIFDLRDWNRILNLSPIGPEAESIRRRMEAQGIMHPSEVFEKPYYPVLKREIVRSWENLFASSDIPDTYIQAASWRLYREWIVSC